MSLPKEDMKPIVLYTHGLGPNPWKVAIVLEELDIPYENRFLQPHEVKEEPYISLNPNGRIPCIEDPNTGMVLWESAAINMYLVQTYDPEGRLWCRQAPQSFHMNQWLFFQMSGQGPYFGQAAWFVYRHSEHIPSAIQRYRTEIRRVLGVLDKALEGKQYLLEDRCTIADLAFIPWDLSVKDICQDEEFAKTLDEDCPNWSSWHKRMLARPAVQRALGKKQRALEDAGPSIFPTKLEANEETN